MPPVSKRAPVTLERMNLSANPRVAVVGATGAVGRVMLDILSERRFPASEIVPLASPRSEGQKIPFGDGTLTVRVLSDEALKEVDLVLLDTPDEVALEWGPRAAESGAVVVDNSAAWRMDPHVPLVVPEINPKAAFSHQGLIASPNCTTIGVAVPLAALHERFGVEKVIVSSYQATSGAGQGGIDELEEQALSAADAVGPAATAGAGGYDPGHKVFSAPILFNLIPMVGSEKEGGFTSEELKMLHETRKIFELPSLDVTATCVRVPTVVGHGASVYAEFEQKVSVQAALEALQDAPGVVLSDLPNPLQAAGTDPCYVGRVRSGADPRSLSFFTVSDNLRKGAALNTVQIAELLLGKDQPSPGG